MQRGGSARARAAGAAAGRRGGRASGNGSEWARALPGLVGGRALARVRNGRTRVSAAAQLRLVGLRARPPRFPNRGRPKPKLGTTLVFWLSAAARVDFVVSGPPPSCRFIGMFSVRGREGRNRIHFLGRLQGGRLLPPGTYTLTPQATRGRERAPLVSVAVKIVAPGARLPRRSSVVPVRRRCGMLPEGAARVLARRPGEKVARSGVAGVQRTFGRDGDGRGGSAASSLPAPTAAPAITEAGRPSPAGLGAPLAADASSFRYLLLAALALAALVFALAAVPWLVPNARVAPVFGRPRFQLAAAAMSVLVFAAVVFLIGRLGF